MSDKKIIFFLPSDGGPKGRDFPDDFLNSEKTPTKKRSLPPGGDTQPRKKSCKITWRNRPTISPPFKLDTIDDLLYIAWNYQGDAFDWFTLWNMIPVLSELNRLVGMKKLKGKIVNLILYYIQGLHLRKGPNGDSISDGDMLHTALYGVPGTGKSTLAHILAKIYCKMGYLPTDNVIVAKKTDFVGKWVGHSEDKTTELLNRSLGGVLFIDEAYSMGHPERTDSFSKTAIDLLNQFLSERKGEMVCIIAGYEKELQECFFSINPGLERRFPRKFTIDSYTGEELHEMFCKKVTIEGWDLKSDAVKKEFFVDNLKSFPFFGGDIDNFFTFCKTEHSRRIFGVENVVKKELNNADIDEGFKTFCEHQKPSKDDQKSHETEQMYI